MDLLELAAPRPSSRFLSSSTAVAPLASCGLPGTHPDLLSRSYPFATASGGAPVSRTLLQRLWRSSNHARPGEVELLGFSTRHVNEGSCAAKAELREGNAGCRPACARIQHPYTQDVCSGHLQRTSSDQHGRSASTTMSTVGRRTSVGGASAAGGAPRARSLLLSSRGRRPGDVVGRGRGSTGRATS